MANGSRAAVPAWYWAVAVLALLWELGGCYAYLTQVSMKPTAMAALDPAERSLWTSMPAWIWAAYAVAVWVGLTGAIALLMRQRWASQAFIVSLVAIVVQFGWVFLVTPILSVKGPSSAAFPAVIFLVGLFLVWFSTWATKRGWLR